MDDEQFSALISAIRSISHGPLAGAGAQPMGLELLSMVVARTDGDSLADAIRDAAGGIAEAMHDQAEATRELARAVRDARQQ